MAVGRNLGPLVACSLRLALATEGDHNKRARLYLALASYDPPWLLHAAGSRRCVTGACRDRNTKTIAARDTNATGMRSIDVRDDYENPHEKVREHLQVVRKK